MLVTVNKGHFLPREEDVHAPHEPVYLPTRRSSDASRVLEVSVLAASSFFFFLVICSFTFPKVQVVLRHSPPHRTLRLRCSHDPVWPAREAPARPRPPSTPAAPQYASPVPAPRGHEALPHSCSFPPTAATDPQRPPAHVPRGGLDIASCLHRTPAQTRPSPLAPHGSHPRVSEVRPRARLPCRTVIASEFQCPQHPAQRTEVPPKVWG